MQVTNDAELIRTVMIVGVTTSRETKGFAVKVETIRNGYERIECTILTTGEPPMTRCTTSFEAPTQTNSYSYTR